MRLLPVLTGCGLALLLCACASTSMRKTWTSPEVTGGPFTKAAVVAIDERPEVRRAIEARLALALQEAGVNVGTTAGMLSLADAKTDKAAAAERLRSTGAQVVVIMRLVDSSMTYRESRPGQERYAGHVSGFQTGTWYDYYSVAFDDMSPTYGTLKQKVYLETGVFDLGTEKHVWSGLTRTGVKETTDRLTEMDNVVAKAVAAMRKDGIFP